MSMDKRWQETFDRLKAVEDALKGLTGGAAETAVVTITKEQLMSIKGVGSSTADAILEMLNA
ncbi:MAG: hypothetical protein KDH16_13300 [Rhodocyclaceae bacterium]|nr:hypothetical protein [Rhodocyclaceae bacterium]